MPHLKPSLDGVKGPPPLSNGGKGPLTPLPGGSAERNRPDICARAAKRG